jgi:hypothetical protein
MTRGIIRHYIFILSKSVNVKMTLVFSIGILTFTFISITKEFINMPLFLQKLGFQSFAFLSVLSFFLFILSTTLQETIINEKITKRLQLLLANGLPLRDIWIGASLANFISNCAIIFFLEAILVILLKVMKINPFPLFSWTFFIIQLINFPLLILAFSFLLVKIILIVRRTEIITGILFASFFLVAFGGSSLFNYLIKKVGPNGDLFTVNVVVIFTLIEIVLLITAFVFRRRLNVEDVTLSRPE